jgi:hypothetical protein
MGPNTENKPFISAVTVSLVLLTERSIQFRKCPLMYKSVYCILLRKVGPCGHPMHLCRPGLVPSSLCRFLHCCSFLRTIPILCTYLLLHISVPCIGEGLFLQLIFVL